MLLSIGALFGSGCALTNSSLPITLAPSVQQPIQPAPDKNLKIGAVEDNRTVSDKAVVFQKVNAYGQKTRGAYIAQKPIGDIFQDALVASLRGNRFPVNDAPGNLRLLTTIEDVDYEVLTGFWTATVEPKFRVKFSVIDEKSNKAVWKEHYIGKVQRKTAWGAGEFMREIFSAAAEDAIRQLVEDKTFRAVFEKDPSATGQ